MERAIGDSEFYDKLTLKTKDFIYPKYKEEFRVIGKLIGRGASVLDVGCGSGALWYHLDDDVSYTGIDYSAVSCQLDPGVDGKILCESLKEHSENNVRQYTDVVMSQVLEHVDDPIGFVRCALNTLKVGGSLYITVPNGDSYLKYLVNGALNLPPHHVSMWNEKSLDTLAEGLGLTKAFVFRETLQDVHEIDFMEAFLYSFGFLREPKEAVRWSLWARTVKKYARYLTWLIPNTNSQVTGHSITIQYRKTT